MRLIPNPNDPANFHDRYQCLDCGYVFLRQKHIFFRILAALLGETCPNCASRKTISIAEAEVTPKLSSRLSS